MRKEVAEQQAERTQFKYARRWTRCIKCKAEVKHEHMWSRVEYGVPYNYRVFLCLKCAPTKPDAIRSFG